KLVPRKRARHQVPLRWWEERGRRHERAECESKREERGVGQQPEAERRGEPAGKRAAEGARPSEAHRRPGKAELERHHRENTGERGARRAGGESVAALKRDEDEDRAGDERQAREPAGDPRSPAPRREREQGEKKRHERELQREQGLEPAMPNLAAAETRCRASLPPSRAPASSRSATPRSAEAT